MADHTDTRQILKQYTLNKSVKHVLTEHELRTAAGRSELDDFDLKASRTPPEHAVCREQMSVLLGDGKDLIPAIQLTPRTHL